MAAACTDRGDASRSRGADVCRCLKPRLLCFSSSGDVSRPDCNWGPEVCACGTDFTDVVTAACPLAVVVVVVVCGVRRASASVTDDGGAKREEVADVDRCGRCLSLSAAAAAGSVWRALVDGAGAGGDDVALSSVL